MRDKDHHRYLSSLIVGQDSPIFSALWKEGQREKVKRLASPLSEDAVTWNVFETIRRTDSFLVFLSSRALAASKEPLPRVEPPSQVEFYFWGRDGLGQPWPLLDSVRREVEAGPRYQRPGCLIVTDRDFFLIEAKLDGDWSLCERGRQGICPGKERCSYWQRGPGLGYILEYFREDHFRFREGEPEKSDCYHFYQLMRSYIIGQELAQKLGKVFHCICLVNETPPLPRLKERLDTFFDFCSRLQDPRPMLLTTWQEVAWKVRVAAMHNPENPLSDLANYLELVLMDAAAKFRRLRVTTLGQG